MTTVARSALEIKISAADLKRLTKKLTSVNAKTIQIDGNSSTMYAMDDDLGICVQSPLLKSELMASVDFNIFKSTVSKLTKDVVLSQSGKEPLKITSAKFKATIPISSDWPVFPVHEPKGFNLNSEKLNNLLSFVNSVTTEKNNFDHTGFILIEGDGHKLSAVATDNHRIAFSDYPLEGYVVPKTIIPAIAVKAIKEFTDTINVFESTACIFFKSDNMTVYARKSTVKFPNIAGAMPKQYILEAKLDVNAFKESLDRVSPVIDPEVTPRVVLDFGDSLTLSTGTDIIGNAEDVLDIEYTVPNKLILAANSKYISEFLTSVAGCVTIKLSGKDRPFLLEAGNRQLLTAGLKV
jgi:DNA polymerase III sliding clamp (beta) subunit (PCNA family)